MRVRSGLVATVGSALSLLPLGGPAASAEVLLGYNLTGAPGSGTAPASWAPTTVAPGLFAGHLVRGPGLDTSPLANGFSADHWGTMAGTTFVAADSLFDAAQEHNYFGWALAVGPGYEVSLSSFDVSLRRSAVAAPSHFELYVTLDDFASSFAVATFDYRGRSNGTAPGTVTPYAWMTQDVPGQQQGNPIPTVDLSGFAELQHIPEGTLVQFRLYAWGDGGGAASNTVGLGRVNGPVIGGTVRHVGPVVPIAPEPAGMIGVAGLAVLALGRRKQLRPGKPTRAQVMGAVIVGSCAAAGAAERPADFGQRWVRENPFTIMGLVGWPETFDVPKYQAASMSTTLVWWADGRGKQTAQKSSGAGIPWHALMVDGEGPEQERIPDYASVGGAKGWMIGDELNRAQMTGFYKDLAGWARDLRPSDLVYTNVFPTYASPEQLYGGPAPAGGYSYAQYLEDTVQHIRPDVLMYDHYPHMMGGWRRPDVFVNMMAVRDKARQHNLPYWAWVQAYSDGFGYRIPSESDVRMQVFAHLAAGYTGLSYFTFDHFGWVSMLSPDGQPTSIYQAVADVNGEVANLGRALRYLTSEQVRYVPGRQMIGTIPVKNITPTGLADWSAENDGDSHILSLVTGSPSQQRNGLFGSFVDDNGDECFMIQNLFSGDGLSPEATALSFVITFDTSVDSLIRLDRETGEQVVVPLVNHTLTVTIPGGTAELYKYNEGWFVVPEPGTLSAAPLVLLAARRRRRH